jgi:hypothetical protein
MPGRKLGGPGSGTVRHGLEPEQQPKAAPVFQRLWNLTGGAD